MPGLRLQAQPLKTSFDISSLSNLSFGVSDFPQERAKPTPFQFSSLDATSKKLVTDFLKCCAKSLCYSSLRHFQR
jgi:hypothetical protein